MAVVHLTDRGLRALHTTRPQEDFWDRFLPGFGVRVSHFGRKSFVLMYRTPEQGRKRRLTLGTYPLLSLADARDRAKAVLVDLTRGIDPQAPKNGHGPSFEKLAALYIEKHAKRKKKSWRVDQQIIAKNLLPVWAKRKAKDITRRDVADVLDTVLERGAAIQANKVRSIISKICNFAVAEDILDFNPAQRIPRPTKPRTRDRVLSESEIAILWAAIEHELEPIVAAAFKLRLLTAQRGVEILSMRWSDIDGDWWTIPAEFAKNGYSHRVPLAPQAAAVLKTLEPLTRDLEAVFPNRSKPHRPIPDREAALHLRHIVGFHFTPHDLRRTAARPSRDSGIFKNESSLVRRHQAAIC